MIGTDGMQLPVGMPVDVDFYTDHAVTISGPDGQRRIGHNMMRSIQVEPLDDLTSRVHLTSMMGAVGIQTSMPPQRAYDVVAHLDVVLRQRAGVAH